jgi:hypothetical protein
MASGSPPQFHPNPFECFRRVTEMQVAIGRQLGDDDGTIVENTKAAIVEALTGDKEWFSEISVNESTEDVVTRAGMYRIVLEHFGLNRADLVAQETWHRIVMDTLTETLAKTDGDFAFKPKRTQ